MLISSHPSPFSSPSKSNKSYDSYSKNNKNYNRSRSKSLSKSSSRSSRSKSNSDRSRKSYHHKQRSIPQVFITRLSHYITTKDLDKEFSKFGDIKNLTLKKGYAFIEFYDKEDAKYAIRKLNGRRLFGQSNRVVVEEAKVSREEREKERRKQRRSKSKDRDNNYYKRRSGPKKTDICYNCGKEGHWANECIEISRRER